MAAGLMIYNTTLQVLGLTSLRTVENGRIIVGMNKELCYGTDIQWQELLSSSTQTVYAKNNAKEELCRKYILWVRHVHYKFGSCLGCVR